MPESVLRMTRQASHKTIKPLMAYYIRQFSSYGGTFALDCMSHGCSHGSPFQMSFTWKPCTTVICRMNFQWKLCIIFFSDSELLYSTKAQLKHDFFSRSVNVVYVMNCRITVGPINGQQEAKTSDIVKSLLKWAESEQLCQKDTCLVL